MPNKTKRGPSNTNYFKLAKTRSAENKEKKLLKHVKLHPNDKQALESNVPDYTPKKPPSVWAKGRYNV